MATAGRYVPPHMRNRGAAPAGAAAAELGARPSPSSPSRGSWTSPAEDRRRPWDQETRSQTSAPPQARPVRRVTAPTLHVFGDSFAGPFKLLDDSSARVRSFKGASAKGLNNPKSIKQVSNELVPLLNSLLAPPPYAYLPPEGRYALLLFGNVDLQINYLWQLQHKPIGPATWAEGEDRQDEAGTPMSASVDLLASATENSGKGPALGPERFVDNIVHAYTSWLKREVVDGPVGRRAAEVASQVKSGADKVLPPTKVLVGAALPPLVEDSTLPRIPEKYVERLEEDHAKAQQLLEGAKRERGSRTPWARPMPNGVAELTSHLSKSSLIDSEPASRADSDVVDGNKIPIQDLLLHDPPLCTKPVRIAMTNRYNAMMGAFCAQYPEVLEFVDVSEAMLAIDAAERGSASSAQPLLDGEVDRVIWACPVDSSNIHPLWEPTLPLWLKALKALGLPTDSFAMSTDAEETFKAYEEDKKRRTAKRDHELQWNDEKTRIKLRDE